MAKKIDRIGETGTNNFGSEMIIVEYRNANDIDIYILQSTTGLLNIDNIMTSKEVKLNVHMNLAYME